MGEFPWFFVICLIFGRCSVFYFLIIQLVLAKIVGQEGLNGLKGLDGLKGVAGNKAVP